MPVAFLEEGDVGAGNVTIADHEDGGSQRGNSAVAEIDQGRAPVRVPARCQERRGTGHETNPQIQVRLTLSAWCRCYRRRSYIWCRHRGGSFGNCSDPMGRPRKELAIAPPPAQDTVQFGAWRPRQPWRARECARRETAGGDRRRREGGAGDRHLCGLWRSSEDSSRPDWGGRGTVPQPSPAGRWDRHAEGSSRPCG